MERTLRAWASQSSHLIGDCFDRAKPMLDQDYEGLPPLVRFVSAQLFIDCHLSSESALLLIGEGKEWDADLIGRAVMEGSLKFTYMLHGQPDEVGSKVDEYWNVLPLFSSIRHGEHAKNFLDAVPDPASPAWRPFHDLLIDTAEVTEIRKRFSRSERQRIEERWSFSGLCKTFASSDEPGLQRFAGLAHGYSMSSHLLHKDADGIGMVWERARRDPSRQRAVTIGHSARVVSDLCVFAKLRLLSLLRACKASVSAISEIESRYEALEQALRAANDEFNRIEYAEGKVAHRTSG